MDNALKEQTLNKVKIHEFINFDSDDRYAVSIIVPTYNNAKYLRECLDSLINQTLNNIEIICVNDGSTDDSLNILKEYAQRDKRIKVIDKENAGYGHSLNIGIDYAQGEYLGIVESDDFVNTDMYRRLYEVATANDLDVVKSNFNRFIGSGDKRTLFFYRIGFNEANYNMVLDPSVRLDVFNFIMNTWSGIYRCSFLREHNVRHNETPGASFQDNGFYFLTTAYTHRFMLIDESYYFNRRDNENSSVFSGKKINAMKEEYDYIDSCLSSDPVLYEHFIFISVHMRFLNYMFTYSRISHEDKLQYLKDISVEMNSYNERGLINPELFSNDEKQTLTAIMNGPEEFHINNQNNDVKISVIILVNNEKYLSECLNSVINQTLRKIEIIIIDNGLSDGALGVIQSFMDKNEKIKLSDQMQQCPGSARNIGIDIAMGKYVAFMDADGCYPSNTVLNDLLMAAEYNGAQICGGSYSIIKNKTRELIISNERPGAIFEKSGFIDYPDYQFDCGFQRFIFLRSFLRENNLYFPDNRFFEGPLFLVQSMLKSEKTYCIPQETYICYDDGCHLDSEDVVSLLQNIKQLLTISSENKLSQLHHNSVMHINHDFLNDIMKELEKSNDEVFKLLLDCSASINNDLAFSEEPLIIKPLYIIFKKYGNMKEESHTGLMNKMKQFWKPHNN